VSLSYFGSVDPSRYGILYDALPSYYLKGKVVRPEAIPPGLVAISATNLQGVLFQESGSVRDVAPAQARGCHSGTASSSIGSRRKGSRARDPCNRGPRLPDATLPTDLPGHGAAAPSIRARTRRAGHLYVLMHRTSSLLSHR
jgi:hypothetical protein